MKVQKLTLKETIDEHRKMWRWIARQCIERQEVVGKREYFYDNNITEDDRMPYNICFCCQYACEDADSYYPGTMCRSCPIKWLDSYTITTEDGKTVELTPAYCTKAKSPFAVYHSSLEMYKEITELENVGSIADSAEKEGLWRTAAKAALEIANLPAIESKSNLKSMSREEIIAEHRRMWNWIADMTMITKKCVNKMEYFTSNGITELPSITCYCCQYTENVYKDMDVIAKKAITTTCDLCPLAWPGEKGVCSMGVKDPLSDALFSRWHTACANKLYGEAAALARAIANLPEREDKEGDVHEDNT